MFKNLIYFFKLRKDVKKVEIYYKELLKNLNSQLKDKENKIEYLMAVNKTYKFDMNLIIDENKHYKKTLESIEKLHSNQKRESRYD